jgi:phosphopentomutase
MDSMKHDISDPFTDLGAIVASWLGFAQPQTGESWVHEVVNWFSREMH